MVVAWVKHGADSRDRLGTGELIGSWVNTYGCSFLTTSSFSSERPSTFCKVETVSLLSPYSNLFEVEENVPSLVSRS